jgi:hypothetical protein
VCSPDQYLIQSRKRKENFTAQSIHILYRHSLFLQLGFHLMKQKSVFGVIISCLLVNNYQNLEKQDSQKQW